MQTKVVGGPGRDVALKWLFQEFDSDGNGELDRTEFAQVLACKCLQQQ
jgi:Ca2+-binding EF-hand superfamily protein